MSLSGIFRRMAGKRAKVMELSDYDKVNGSDDIKGDNIKKAMCRNINSVRKANRTEEDTIMETDLNVHAELQIGNIIYKATENGAYGNLISVILIDGESVGAASIKVKKKHITIKIEDGVTNFDTIKAALDADSRALSLLGATISGSGAAVASINDKKQLSGGK